jgi:5-methylcytosine-specific restriction enzyme subunit McrC
MTTDKIPIRNIYYMLAYSHNVLHFKEYEAIGKEDFKHLLELYATILSLGIPVLIRGGLIKEYNQYSTESMLVRGKINLTETIKTNSLVKKKLVLDIDEFSEDNLMNQIIKATLVKAARVRNLSRSLRKKLEADVSHFKKVTDIKLESSLWDSIIYTKHNKRYQFVLTICKYLFEQSLLDQHGKDNYIKKLEDEKNLSALFEKFVYELYKRETDYKVSHDQISWQTDDGYQAALPRMQTDIVLHDDGFNKVIIDTKFYSNPMSKRFENAENKQLSHNLNQMFTYINNWTHHVNEQVGGIILYAKTTHDYLPNHDYWIKGNSLCVKTVDLNQDFKNICSQLLTIADSSMKRIKKSQNHSTL